MPTAIVFTPQAAKTGCTPQSLAVHNNYTGFTSQTAIAGPTPQNTNHPAPLKLD